MEEYGLKYELDYCSVKSEPLRLEIHKKGYTGAATKLIGADEPFIIKYKDSGLKDDGMNPSMAEINIIETGGITAEDLISQNNREHLVKFFLNGNLYWIGWQVPDYIQSEYKYKAIISLPVTDWLSALKDAPYLDDRGNYFTGRQRLLDVVCNCLKRTDLGLDIHVLNDTVCAEWSPILPIDPPNTVNTILSSTYIHSERFSDSDGNVMNCYDILETTMTLLTSTLRQEGGKWSIFNIEQRAKGIGNIDSFSSKGARLGRTSLLTRLIQIGQGKEALSLIGMTEKINPVYYNTEIFSEHGPYFPLIDNINFENFQDGKYPGWTNTNGFSVVNTDLEIYRFNIDGTVSEGNPIASIHPKINSGAIFKSAFPMPGSILDIDNSPYMKSSSFNVVQGEKISFKIGFRGFPEDEIYAVVKIGEYFLLHDYSWSKSDTSAKYVSFTIPRGEDRPGNQRPFAGSEYFEVETSGAPISEIAELRIYGHKKGGSNNFQLTLLGLDLVKESPNIKRATGIVFSVVNKGDYNHVPERKLTIFSDLIENGVSYSEYLPNIRPIRGGISTQMNNKLTSILKNRRNELTENWRRYEVEENSPLNRIAAGSIASMNRATSKEFKGDIYVKHYDPSSISIIDCNDWRVFLFTGGEIRPKHGIVSGKWSEIII